MCWGYLNKIPDMVLKLFKECKYDIYGWSVLYFFQFNFEKYISVMREMFDHSVAKVYPRKRKKCKYVLF